MKRCGISLQDNSVRTLTRMQNFRICLGVKRSAILCLLFYKFVPKQESNQKLQKLYTIQHRASRLKFGKDL